MEEKKLPIIEALNTLEALFNNSKMGYYALNDELKQFENKAVEGETLVQLHRCIVAMDDIFAEEIGPVLQFIANHYVQAGEMSKRHYEFKIANAQADQDMRKRIEESKIIL